MINKTAWGNKGKKLESINPYLDSTGVLFLKRKEKEKGHSGNK